MIKICRCGKAFETKHSRKIYCERSCQVKYSREDAWTHVKQDYKHRCRKLCDMAKFRAKTQGLTFNLSTEYLIELWELQNGCCALSGRIFELERPEKFETVKANAPSLDRIQPNKGYVKENVRFVCYQVNTALNEYGEKALLALCKDIIKFKVDVT